MKERKQEAEATLLQKFAVKKLVEKQDMARGDMKPRKELIFYGAIAAP